MLILESGDPYFALLQYSERNVTRADSVVAARAPIVALTEWPTKVTFFESSGSIDFKMSWGAFLKISVFFCIVGGQPRIFRAYVIEE